MIYLTTGANGAGKTLLMLRDVRAQQLKENRPVYFHGFEAGPMLTKDFGWIAFDPKKWQDLPDGSICVMDECQNEFPLRRSGSEVPEYINAIAQFRRKRGFDFWMTTPHPMLLDVFVRRLIDNPSWHRHIKRVAGSQMVSVLKWNAVKVDCEKPGSGDSGEVSMQAFPKEVFNWYSSAQLHTGKVKIPKAVYVLGLAIVGAIVFGYYASQHIISPNAAKLAKGASSAASAPVAPGSTAQSAGSGPKGARQVVSTADYLSDRTPRIAGLQHTAPAYDAVTAPVDAPYPAACVQGYSAASKEKECRCYTQQATRLQTPQALCEQIVANGFFMEWHKTGAPPVVSADTPVLNQKGPEAAKAQPAATAPLSSPDLSGIVATARVQESR